MTGRSDHSAWFVLADSRHARLYQCTRAPVGRLHLQERGTMQYAWEGHEHGRPSPLAGKTGHSYAAAHHDVEEDEHRFARQITDWLERTMRQRHLERLIVYAPPRFVGVIRDVCPQHLKPMLDLRAEDLINLTMNALQEHPAIQHAAAALTSDA